ncbi:MAG: cupin domain-containing protein [Lachnospiraceae bacterium]|nr:cupin domain-containing protein [Lachnospiraceae bacterium]
MEVESDVRREGKFLAKFGEGTKYPGEYGIYVEQTDQVLNRENFLVGNSYCVPGHAHETHVHEDHDEVIVYLNGVGIQTIGTDIVYEVRDNDMVYIPAGMPHSIRNISDQPLKMVIVKVNKGRVRKETDAV